MDSLRAAAEAAKNLAKKAAKNVKRFAKFIAALPFIIKLIALLSIVAIVAVAVDFIAELVQSNNNVNAIYSTLDVQDLKQLVEIKKSEDGSGYYIDFKAGIEDKLKKIIDDANTKSGVHNLPTSTEFLRKIIKAELATQFPDLGGNIPKDSDGFQGTVKIRRITPNKDIGSMTSPSRDTTTTIEPDTSYDPNSASADEATVKSWKSGQKLYTTENAVVYEQKESELNPGSDTGYWYEKILENSTDTKEQVARGTEVTYTGTYKKSTNPLSKNTVIYVQVKNGDKTIYLMSTNLSTSNPNTQASNVTENSKNIRVAVTSRAGETTQDKIVGNDASKTFTVAIGAGHNNTDNTGARSKNGDLKEEDLTIQVAEKVEQLLKEYKNVKVVQVGSTSDNRGGVKVEDRTKKARDAKPDLCIQIHFNSGGGTGVETIYKDGDGISQQLAEMLADSISSAMGLENRGAGTDIEKAGVGSLGIIENAATSQFPSVVTEGGFLDNDKDYEIIKNGDGVNKYAQGIVDGVLKYLVADHSGYTSTVTTNQQVQESIESRIYNLKYVTPEEMDGYVNSNNQEALKCYTLDENNNVITATWTYDGSVHIQKNAPLDFRTSLQNYIMPYEYLLFFYIDTNETSFPERLADEVLNSQIILAVQDNVTTTQTTTTTYTKTDDSDGEKQSTSSSTSETCTPQIEITYADTWCAKFSKESSYSDEELGWKDGDTEKIVNVKGTVTVTNSGASSSEYTDDNGNTVRTASSTTTMAIKYESGDSKVQGNENKFVKAYQETGMVLVREAYILKLIENNDRTANLLDLTKYLIYKASNDNLGVIEFDFSVFDIKGFTSTSVITGSDALWEYIKAWEGNEGVSPDGTKYRIGLVNGNRTVGYGVDLETSGTEPKFIAAGYSTNAGDYVDIDFVDNISKEELQAKRNYVIGKTSTCQPPLNDQQIDALTAITYQYGNIGNFVSVYNQYGNTDQLRQNVVANGYHYFIKGPESNGRPDANWKLFHEGIYTDSQGNEIKVASGGNIVEQAVQLHKYLRENGYVYLQAGITVPNTASKTIDCSSYVTWVLVNAKVPGFTSGMYQWTSARFRNNELGWQTVSPQDAQPGDIIAYDGHVEIIAKNDPNRNDFLVYNCGSDNAIQATGRDGLPESSYSGRSKSSGIILRVPQ